MSKSNKHPVFLCDETEQGQWTFWCPFCRKQHWHSAGFGHRVSHCWTPEGKAAMPNGYILRQRTVDAVGSVAAYTANLNLVAAKTE